MNSNDKLCKAILEKIFPDLDFRNIFPKYENIFLECIFGLCFRFFFSKSNYCIINLLFQNDILIFDFFLNLDFQIQNRV